MLPDFVTCQKPPNQPTRIYQQDHLQGRLEKDCKKTSSFINLKNNQTSSINFKKDVRLVEKFEKKSF